MKKGKPQNFENRKNDQTEPQHEDDDSFYRDQGKWSKDKKKNKRIKPAHKNWEH